MPGSTIGNFIFVFDNPSLTSLSAWIGSTVGGNVFITRNQSLSTQSVQLWALQLTVSGTIGITENKLP
jgi:hypothetical protein